MEEKKVKLPTPQEMIQSIYDRLDDLESKMYDKFERMKKVIIDYMNLGSDLALGSLITALKQV